MSAIVSLVRRRTLAGPTFIPPRNSSVAVSQIRNFLDIGLPDKDGHEVLRELRQWSQAPVIMFTMLTGEAEKVAALDAGANDYVTRPFGVQELMARVRALLRQHAAEGNETLPVFDDGNLRIDLSRREAHLAGEPVSPARKEYTLFALLLHHAGCVVTQPQLLKEVWGPAHPGRQAAAEAGRRGRYAEIHRHRARGRPAIPVGWTLGFAANLS